MAETASRGVIMTAHGERYVALAVMASRFLKKSNPDIPIHLFCDAPIDAPTIDSNTVLDEIWHRVRLDCLLQSPFERTLAIDCDAFVMADIADIFEVLDYYDIAFCHDQQRNYPLPDWGEPLPLAMPELNGGFIVYRQSDAVKALFRKWRETTEKDSLKRDQGALRRLLVESDTRPAILPPEFNLHSRNGYGYGERFTAPRVIHSPRLHKVPAVRKSAFPILIHLGPRQYIRFCRALRQDRYLKRAGKVPSFAHFMENRPRAVQYAMLKTLAAISMRPSNQTDAARDRLREKYDVV